MIAAWADGRQVIDVEGMFVNNPRTLHVGGQSTAYCDTSSTKITQKLSPALVRQGLLVSANSKEKNTTQQHYSAIRPDVLQSSSASGTYWDRAVIVALDFE